MDQTVSDRYLHMAVIAGLHVSDWDYDSAEGHIVVGLPDEGDHIVVKRVTAFPQSYERYYWQVDIELHVNTLAEAVAAADELLFDYREGMRLAWANARD